MKVKFHRRIIVSVCLLSFAFSQTAHAEDRFAHLKYLSSAELNWQAQKREEALKDMDKCIEAYTGNAEAYAARASMRGALGNDKGARDDCSSALKLNPDMDYARQIRVSAEMALDDYKGAIDDLNVLISKRSNDPKFYLTRADAYSSLKNEKMARKDIDKALELDPSSDKAQRSLLIWSYQFENFKEALPLAEKYAAKNPKSSDAVYLLALICSGSGQYQKAIDGCNQAIKLDPQNFLAFGSRGYYKMILKDYKGSLEDSDYSLKLNSKYAVALENKALVYFIQRNYLKAADCYKSVARLYDEKDRAVKAHLLAAFNYKLAGKAKESLAEMVLSKKEAEKTNLGTLVSYMEGGVTDEKVLAVSSSLDYQRPAKMMMAIESLRLKKVKEARNYFNWLVVNGVNGEDETHLARAFLERKALP